MKYCRVENGLVVEIFPYNPFEWIPNEAFLAECMECPDEVLQGFIYEDRKFKNPMYKTPQEERQLAYEELIIKDNTNSLINWENQNLTVDQANKIYLEYFAENNSKSTEIQQLIISAKEYIRNLYPDN